jgi:peptide/nickel transport system permease protein
MHDSNPSKAAEGGDEKRMLVRAFLRHRLAYAGLIGLALIVIITLAGTLLLPLSSDGVNLNAVYAMPSWSHPLGTDQLGRDLLARVLAGARVSLVVALSATAVASVLGCLYGLLAGMGPAWLDRALMLILDSMLSIPILLLVIVSQVFGDSSMFKVILVIGLASWMGTARLLRTECRRLLQTEFVSAAIVGGASRFGLALRHILPNAAAPLSVVVTVGIGQSILIESTLSFLNLGVPATSPSWGNLLGNGMSSILSGAWWMVLFPGLMIVLTVLAINLVGDGLRDTVDPKRRATL